MEAYEVLKWAIKSMVLLYSTPFQVLLDDMEQTDKDIFEGIQAVICNDLYHIGHIAQSSNLWSNCLSLQFYDLSSCFQQW